MNNIMLFKPLFRKEEVLDEIGQCLDIGWTGIGGMIMLVYALKGTTFEKTVEPNKNNSLIIQEETRFNIFLFSIREKTTQKFTGNSFKL